MPSIEPERWLTVKLVDSLPIALGAGEVVSMASLVELASPLLPFGTLDAILVADPQITPLTQSS